ncbi:hypothetical protein GQ457_06G015680 [Hibiscus cannabinus]
MVEIAAGSGHDMSAIAVFTLIADAISVFHPILKKMVKIIKTACKSQKKGNDRTNIFSCCTELTRKQGKIENITTESQTTPHKVEKERVKKEEHLRLVLSESFVGGGGLRSEEVERPTPSVSIQSSN